MRTLTEQEAKAEAVKARTMAANLRAEGQASRAQYLDMVADIFDPKPPTLTDLMSAKFTELWNDERLPGADVHAAAMREVVLDWLDENGLHDAAAAIRREVQA